MDPWVPSLGPIPWVPSLGPIPGSHPLGPIPRSHPLGPIPWDPFPGTHPMSGNFQNYSSFKGLNPSLYVIFHGDFDGNH